MTGSLQLGKTFSTLEELNAAVKQYAEAEHHVPYIVFNSRSAKSHNASVDVPERMPEEMRWKEVTFACKHHGKLRQHQHVEGKKRRSNQSTFKRGCPAKFCINYVVSQKCFQVTKIVETHENHELPAVEMAQCYPEFRRPSKETIEEVNGLFEYGVKKHRITNMILSTGVKVTGQDIQNLRNKWRFASNGNVDSDEEALFNELQLMKEEDPHSIVVVQYHPNTFVIESVFFQPSEMRKALELYPEVLIMDTTYKVCNNDMPLIVFDVVDCHGSGRVVGYALIISEKKEVVTGSLEALTTGCPDLAEKVFTVVIDKAQSEIASIKKVLPSAEVHLCDYHVKDNFKKRRVTSLAPNWEAVKPLVDKLIHAYTKNIYDETYLDLQRTSGKESDFMKYFNKNWHNSDLVWTEYRRNQTLTLGERTTGKVERHNGYIKEAVDRKTTPAEVVRSLRLLHKCSTNEVEHKLFRSLVKTSYHKYSTDPVVQQILKINTPFVGDLLKRQYERSLEPQSANVHEVTIDKCDCPFFTKYKLICSHIFRERKLKGVEIYDHTLVPERWTVVVPSCGAEKKQDLSLLEVLAAPCKAPTRPKPLLSNDRYNMAHRICERICSMVASVGGKQFHNRIAALKNMEDLLKMGKEVAVVGLDASGQPDSAGQERSNEPIPNAEFCHETSPLQTEATPIGRQDAVGDVVLNAASLDENLRKLLKLPPKPTVLGCPKGKRKEGKRVRKKGLEKCNSSEEEDDEDDVNPVNLCPSCNGPIICRTSFTKKNYKKKYISCSTPKNERCKAFLMWVNKNFSIATEAKKSDDQPHQQHPLEENGCIVCKTSGPPPADGGHKCDLCGIPVHGLDGAPCCSIPVNPDMEGYGGHGRRCLKCIQGKTSSQSVSTVAETELKELKPLPLLNNSGDIVLITLDDSSESDCTISDNNNASKTPPVTGKTSIPSVTTVAEIDLNEVKLLPLLNNPADTVSLTLDDSSESDCTISNNNNGRKTPSDTGKKNHGRVADIVYLKCFVCCKECEDHRCYVCKALVHPSPPCSKVDGYKGYLCKHCTNGQCSSNMSQPLYSVGTSLESTTDCDFESLLTMDCLLLENDAIMSTFANLEANANANLEAVGESAFPNAELLNTVQCTEMSSLDKGERHYVVSASGALDPVLPAEHYVPKSSTFSWPATSTGSCNQLILKPTFKDLKRTKKGMATSQPSKRPCCDPSQKECGKEKIKEDISHSLRCSCPNKARPCEHVGKISTMTAKTQSPKKDYRCSRCNDLLQRGLCGNGKNKGKYYYFCKKCDIFRFWASKEEQPVSVSKQPVSVSNFFTTVTHNRTAVSSSEGRGVTLQEESEVPCKVCSISGNGAITSCVVCQGNCHVDVACSFTDYFENPNGIPSEDKRVCKLCICDFCKCPKRQEHSCACVVCKLPTTDMLLCMSCHQPMHATECSCEVNSDTVGCRLCWNCLYSQNCSLTRAAVSIIQTCGMLTDDVIALAMEVLHKQFPHIDGLQYPIADERSLLRDPPFQEDHRSYKACTKAPYIQIISTGHEHWITCFKPRNVSKKIMVLNSSGAEAIGSFVEQQLALIMNLDRDDSDFEVAYPKVKGKEDGTDQCGPLAVAYATELAFTDDVSYVDFNVAELYPHLLKCLLQKKLERFPRQGEVKTASITTVEKVEVCCSCRLPYHYDKHVIKCSACRTWYHYQCEGLASKPSGRRYTCRSCSSLLVKN